MRHHQALTASIRHRFFSNKIAYARFRQNMVKAEEFTRAVCTAFKQLTVQRTHVGRGYCESLSMSKSVSQRDDTRDTSKSCHVSLRSPVFSFGPLSPRPLTSRRCFGPLDAARCLELRILKLIPSLRSNPIRVQGYRTYTDLYLSFDLPSDSLPKNGHARFPRRPVLHSRPPHHPFVPPSWRRHITSPGSVSHSTGPL